jgi:polysaccharide pyruvyl transferase WcaK-like protein
MLTCVNWLKQSFPAFKLYVATASDTPDYIIPFTNGLVMGILPIAPEPQADLMVHGGGGTFYDYHSGGLTYQLLNRLIGTMGVASFKKGLTHYRQLKGWSYSQDTRRIALGIGVSTFTTDSKKYYHKVVELSSLDVILPRDPYSLRILKGMGLPGKLIQSSDLAFLDSYWLPPDLRQHGNRKNIGFVIKNWPSDNSYLQLLKKAASLLQDQGYTVTLYLFEKTHDRYVKTVFKGFGIEEWCPRSRSLTDYLRSLAKNDLLVTSRAHGAIIGAALNIPSLCVGIEPKLDQIAQMFPQSGQYVSAKGSLTDLYSKIMMGLQTPISNVKADFTENSRIVLDSLNKLKHLILNEN